MQTDVSLLQYPRQGGYVMQLNVKTAEQIFMKILLHIVMWTWKNNWLNFGSYLDPHQGIYWKIFKRTIVVAFFL